MPYRRDFPATTRILCFQAKQCTILPTIVFLAWLEYLVCWVLPGLTCRNSVWVLCADAALQLTRFTLPAGHAALPVSQLVLIRVIDALIQARPRALDLLTPPYTYSRTPALLH